MEKNDGLYNWLNSCSASYSGNVTCHSNRFNTIEIRVLYAKLQLMKTPVAGKQSNNNRGDIIALGFLLFISFLYLFLTAHKILLADDHVWPMQVAARIAKGNILYRDVWWAYPPLPIYLLSFLYRLFGANFMTTIIMNQILAILAFFLTYRVARFLLSPGFALPSTLVVFMGGLEWRGGGFLAYMFTYTTGISIGGLLGLLFVISLISYFKSNNLFYLVCAGIFTGLCFLTKPEYALATFGTAIVFFVILFVDPIIFHKNDLYRDNIRTRFYPFFAYMISIIFIAGMGYGYLIHKAGWRNVIAGITGYGQIDLVVHTRPPWGNANSWLTIFAGFGLNLLIILAIVIVLFPKFSIKQRVGFILLASGGIGLFIVPLIFLVGIDPYLISQIFGSKYIFLKKLITAIWAPSTLILGSLIIFMVFHCCSVSQKKQPVAKEKKIYLIFAVFSGLLAVRYFFNFNTALSAMYLAFTLPIFLFSIIDILPKTIEKRTGAILNHARSKKVLLIVLSLLSLTGFALDYKWLSFLNNEIKTPRGNGKTVSFQENKAMMDTLNFILSHSNPEDKVAVLGVGPRLSFYSGRVTPIKQDYFRNLTFSKNDIFDLTQRIKNSRPKLIVTLCQLKKINVSLRRGIKIDYKNIISLSSSFNAIWNVLENQYQIEANFDIARELGSESWESYVIFKLL